MDKRNVSIKRTVCKNLQMTLLKVQYDLKMALGIAKRTVSIKRTVCNNLMVSTTFAYDNHCQLNLQS